MRGPIGVEAIQKNSEVSIAPGLLHSAHSDELEQAIPQEQPPFSSFEDLVAWVSLEREGILHGHLFYDTHLVSFAPPCLTLRLSQKAPKNLAQQLELLLKKKKNETWTIAISDEIGHPTLHEKEETIHRDRQKAILQEPLVKMIIEAFPGTTLIDSHDK